MIKPWKIGICVFVVFTLFAGWISSVQAPTEMVEMELTGLIDQETLDWLRSDYDGIKPSVWFQRESSDYRLIMTSGNDRFYQKNGPGTGRWVIESDQNKMVLGENLVDQYFQRHDVVGREMEFMGESYEVVGVAKDSQMIWIPYQEELAKSLDWDRRTLHYQIPNDKFEETFISQLRQQFRRFDISVLYVVNHSNWRSAYFNAALSIALLFVCVRFFRKGKQTLREGRNYIHEYRLTHRLKSVTQYLSENRAGAVRLGKEFIAAILWGGALVLLLRYLDVPISLRPKNFFSLVSYRQVMLDWGQRIALNLRHGLSDFQIGSVKLWTLGFVLSVATAWFAAARRRKNG